MQDLRPSDPYVRGKKESVKDGYRSTLVHSPGWLKIEPALWTVSPILEKVRIIHLGVYYQMQGYNFLFFECFRHTYNLK